MTDRTKIVTALLAFTGLMVGGLSTGLLMWVGIGIGTTLVAALWMFGR
jgi:hypothetical protein